MSGTENEIHPRWPIRRASLQKLTRKKYRQEFGLYLVEGAAAVRDAITAGAKVLGVLFDERAEMRDTDRQTLLTAADADVPSQEISQQELSKMSDLATVPPVIAVLAQDRTTTPVVPEAGELVLALDRIQDPGNAGTLLRAAAFYGIQQVWLGKGTVDIYNPKVVRAAMSAHYHLRISVDVDLPALLRENAEKMISYVADMDGEEMPTEELANRDLGSVLIMGNEPQGIQEELMDLADQRLAIIRRGPIDSLNVAMAGTILIDRLARK